MSFSEGTFLAVDKVTVRWELLPLLSKQVLVKAIILEKPQINLIRTMRRSKLQYFRPGGSNGPPRAKTVCLLHESTDGQARRNLGVELARGLKSTWCRASSAF